MIALSLLALARLLLQDSAPQIPIRPGLVIVQAVAGDVEKPNATPEGRARNRRVELVRPCANRTQ